MRALITANVDRASRDRLADLGVEIVDYDPIAEREGRLPPDELAARLDGIELFVVGYEGVPADVLDAAPDLDLVACARGGPDANVDIEAAAERGIPVLYAPGRNAASVADFTLGLLVDVARNISRAHRLLHEGVYTGEPRSDAAAGGGREDVTWGIAKGSPYAELSGPELGGKTLGIVGFGDVGREVAERAVGFGMELVACDPHVDAATMAASGVEPVDLEALCSRADFVTLHAAVTPATRGLIGADELALVDGGYLINTARGALVDEDALVAALRDGTLRGAALDVYAEEPLPADHPLLDLDTVVTTPHLAGAAEEVVSRHSTMLVDDIARLLAGREPEHVANPGAVEAFFDRRA